MAMTTCLLLFSSSILILWISHRIYDAYVHVVGREERLRLRRLVAPGTTMASHRHIGPKCFLFLDGCAVLGIILSLRTLGFDFASSGVEPWHAAILSFSHFSLVIALWLLLEGRHLSHYYEGLARAARALRNEGSGRGGSRVAQVAMVCALVAAACPLFLHLLGRPLGAEDAGDSLLVFLACFLGPQLVVASVLLRSILPLRRLAYDRLDRAS